MLLSKLLHVAYCTRTINTPLSLPLQYPLGCPNPQEHPGGPILGRCALPCPAWRSGHNVKFFLVEVGAV